MPKAPPHVATGPSLFEQHARRCVHAVEKKISRSKLFKGKIKQIRNFQDERLMARARVSHKKVKFDLDGNDHTLMHNGKPAEQAQDFFPMQQQADLAEQEADHANFTGFDQDARKSKKEIYEELIYKSKENKRLQQRDHQEALQKTKELNQSFRMIAGKLYQRGEKVGTDSLFDMNQLMQELRGTRTVMPGRGPSEHAKQKTVLKGRREAQRLAFKNQSQEQSQEQF